MPENLKQLMQSHLTDNGFNTKDINDIIEEYESEQTFTELEDGTFEMITGNTTADVIAWLQKNKYIERN